MELQLITKPISVMETVFDDFDERPVDCDFVLPDYLPDMAAILKCLMKPVVQTYQISGDRVMAEGITTLKILYLDEERRCVRTFEATQPFTSVFTVKTLDSNDRILLSAKVNYVNCRATGPRRVDIHGAFSVKLVVRGCREYTMVESSHDPQLQMQPYAVDYSVPTAFVQKTFTVNEVVELENGGEAELLVRTEATPHILECKPMVGKALVKGEILLKTVYVTNSVEGSMGCSQNTLLFSQILDVEGLTENCLCSCQASLVMCEAHPTQDPGGAGKLVSFTGKVMMTVEAYCQRSGMLLADVYHTRYPLKTEYRTLTVTQMTDISRDTLDLTLTVELPDAEIRSIADMWFEVLSVTPQETVDATTMNGQILVCMLTRDSQNILSYYERPLVFEHTFGDNRTCAAISAEVLRHTCAISGNRLDLQLTVMTERVCAVSKDCCALCAAVADGMMPYAKPVGMERCGMKVYFAGAGETLWDIAKAQHVPVEELRSENELSGDVLEQDTMLLFSLT